MIIDENNKMNNMRFKFNRGFNQTPEELKEKLHSDLKSYKASLKPKEEAKIQRPLPQDMKKAMENLRKLN